MNKQILKRKINRNIGSLIVYFIQKLKLYFLNNNKEKEEKELNILRKKEFLKLKENKNYY